MPADTSASQRTVHLFVFDGFADWEAAYAIAGINSPAFQLEPGTWCVKTAGVSEALVRSMGGVAVLPDTTLDRLSPRDSAMLVLPGGLGWDHGEHQGAVDKAREFLDAQVPVAAICGATAGLARAGLLDERRHTSNALAYLKGTGYRGSDRYENVAAFDDGLLITAGGMAPLEFTREIFKRLGIYSDEAIEAWYALYRTGESAQFARLQQLAAA